MEDLGDGREKRGKGQAREEVEGMQVSVGREGEDHATKGWRKRYCRAANLREQSLGNGEDATEVVVMRTRYKTRCRQ